MQEAGYGGVFHGSDPWRLHHQPRVQLGGPSGPERLPTTRQPGGQPEARARHGGQDGENNVCVVVRQRDKRSSIKAVIVDVIHCAIQDE